MLRRQKKNRQALRRCRFVRAARPPAWGESGGRGGALLLLLLLLRRFLLTAAGFNHDHRTLG